MGAYGAHEHAHKFQLQVFSSSKKIKSSALGMHSTRLHFSRIMYGSGFSRIMYGSGFSRIMYGSGFSRIMYGSGFSRIMYGSGFSRIMYGSGF